ncbi:MAG: hypothetical protein SGPRY_002042 [Prymnesium sp.]
MVMTLKYQSRKSLAPLLGGGERRRRMSGERPAEGRMAVEMRLESPSDDLLKLISNDSPTDLPHSWSSQTGGSLWEGRELFSVNGHSGAVRNGCANGNGGAQSPHESRDAKLVHLAPKRCNGGAGISAAAMRHNPHQPQHHPNHPPHNPHQQQQVNPMLQQQMLMHAQQQAKDAMAKVSLLQSTLQQQQKLLQGHEEENMQLQKALQGQDGISTVIALQTQPRSQLTVNHNLYTSERDEEVARLHKREEKLQTAKDAELAQLKQVLQKEKEEKLAKLNAAHNKRITSKEEETQQLKAALTKEKEREVARLSAAHSKQLKARDEELATLKASSLGKDKDERIAKLSSSIKELKSALGSKEQEASALRKQLGSAQRAEEDLRKQHASVANAAQKEERQKNDAIAKIKGSVEQAHPLILLFVCELFCWQQLTMSCVQAHLDKLKKLSDEHTLEVGSKNKEMANLTAQLKQAMQSYQTAQNAVERERDKVREALIESCNLAEISMNFSAEEEAAIVSKVKQNVQECTVKELHWMMTKEFRVWLTQSYTECDEVCDALEAEQQRLKRIYHSKEQDLGKMRARAVSALGELWARPNSGHLYKSWHWRGESRRGN